MIKALSHFDSIDGIMNYDTILKTNHCYNTTIKINKPLRKYKRNIFKIVRNAFIF